MTSTAGSDLACDAMAASLGQPCLTREGAVAFYQGRWGALTLGAPFCEPSQQLAEAHAFLARHPDASFFYVSTAQAARLEATGLRAVPIGEEFLVDLPATQWSAPVTSAARKATKAGLTLRELMGDELTKWAPAMREVQGVYLQRHEVKHELQFLNRPCRFEAEAVGRTFGLFVREQFLGFVVVDPYVTERGLPGALLNIFRIGPTKLWGVYLAVVKLLAERLAVEGFAELSLGFVPLSFSGRPPRSAQLRLLRMLARTSPYLRGLAVIKAPCCTRRETRWLLTSRPLLARDVVTLCDAMDVFRKRAAR